MHRTASADQEATVEGAWVDAEGHLRPQAAFMLRDGKIASRAETNPADFDESAPGPRVICPGLFDLWSTLGVEGADREGTTAVTPPFSIADAISGENVDLNYLYRGGVTGAAVWPAPVNLIGPSAAAVRFSPYAATRFELTGQPITLLSLSSDVMIFNREPTSLMGAADLLRRALKGEGDELAVAAIQSVKAGSATAILYVDAPEQIQAANDLFAEIPERAREPARRDGRRSQADVRDAAASFTALPPAKPALALGCPVRDCVQFLEPWKDRPIVLGPLGWDSGPEQLQGAGLLEKAGFEVALAGRSPWTSSQAIRLTAALAVRYGLSPEAARRAITINPARVAGVDLALGSLDQGRMADMVVFSGDPLRPDSRVLEVYVGGRLVYSGRTGRVAEPAR